MDVKANFPMLRGVSSADNIPLQPVTERQPSPVQHLVVTALLPTADLRPPKKRLSFSSDDEPRDPKAPHIEPANRQIQNIASRALPGTSAATPPQRIQSPPNKLVINEITPMVEGNTQTAPISLFDIPESERPSKIIDILSLLPGFRDKHLEKLNIAADELNSQCWHSWPISKNPSAALEVIQKYPDLYNLERFLPSIVEAKLQVDGSEGFEEWLSDAIECSLDELPQKARAHLLAAVNTMRREGKFIEALAILKKIFPASDSLNSALRCTVDLLRSGGKQEIDANDLMTLSGFHTLFPNDSHIQFMFQVGCFHATESARAESLASTTFHSRSKEHLQVVCQHINSAHNSNPSVSPPQTYLLSELYRLCGDIQNPENVEELKRHFKRTEFRAIMDHLLTLDIQTATLLAEHMDATDLYEFIFKLAKKIECIHKIKVAESVVKQFEKKPVKYPPKELESVAKLLKKIEKDCIALEHHSLWSVLTAWCVVGLLKTDPVGAFNACALALPQDYDALLLIIIEHVAKAYHVPALVFAETTIIPKLTKKTLQEEALAKLGLEYALMGQFKLVTAIIDRLTADTTKYWLMRRTTLAMCLFGQSAQAFQVLKRFPPTITVIEILRTTGQFLLALKCFDESQSAYRQMATLNSDISLAMHPADGCRVALCQEDLQLAADWLTKVPEEYPAKAELRYLYLKTASTECIDNVSDLVKNKNFKAAERVVIDLLHEIPPEQRNQPNQEQVDEPLQIVEAKFAYTQCAAIVAREYLVAAEKSDREGRAEEATENRYAAFRLLNMMDDSSAKITDRLDQYTTLVKGFLQNTPDPAPAREDSDSEAALDVLSQMIKIYQIIELVPVFKEFTTYCLDTEDLQKLIYLTILAFNLTKEQEIEGIRNVSLEALRIFIAHEVYDLSEIKPEFLFPLLESLLVTILRSSQNPHELIEIVCYEFGQSIIANYPDFDFEALCSSIIGNEQLKSFIFKQLASEAARFCDKINPQSNANTQARTDDDPYLEFILATQ